MRSASILVLFLGGCPAPQDTDKDTDTGVPNDSADTADSADTGDGADTADSGDSGDSGQPENVSFRIDGEGAGLTLSLTWLDPATLGTDSLSFGGAYASATVDAEEVGFWLDDPPAEALAEPDPENAPGLLAAFYVPALHLDTDGDGVRSGEESWLGVGVWWLVWVGGEIPGELLASGLLPGWNGVYLFNEAGPDFVAPEGLALPVNLLPNEVISVSGTFDQDPTGLGLVVVPGVVFGGGSVEAWVYDEPLTGTWEVALTGAPPDDHFGPIENFADDVALEIPLSYDDVDEDGAFGAADGALWPACYGDSVAMLLYLPGVTDLGAALMLAMQGVGTGWMAMTGGESGGLVLDETARGELVISPDCTFD